MIEVKEMKVQNTFVSIVLCVLVSCSGYINPDDSFMSADIRFIEKKLNERNINPGAFVLALQKVVVGGKSTVVHGWKKEDRSMVLHSEIGGSEYEFIFTEVMTDSEGKRLVVFQSVRKNKQNVDPRGALDIVFGE